MRFLPALALIAASLLAQLAMSGVAEAASDSRKIRPVAKSVKPTRAAKAEKPAPRKALARNTNARKTVVLARTGKATVVRVAAAAPTKAVKPLRISYRKAAPRIDADEDLVLDHAGLPSLRSASVLVQDQTTGRVLLEKNAESVVPIASITKLMTSMVVLDAAQGLSETLEIGDADVDVVKGSSSRLPVGTMLTREEMLRLALMASENRAASSLSRHYPGGFPAFVAAMNRKAREIGLTDTRFHDGTGLNPDNVSSARDLVKMVSAASRYPLIRQFSTTSEYEVEISGRMRRFGNTNALVRSPDWEIGVSKTGYISESGRCLVMQAWMHDKPLIIVLLDSLGKYTRTADAQRIRKWLETGGAQRMAAQVAGATG